MSNLNLDKLDRLYAEATNRWEADGETLLFHEEQRLAYAKREDATFIAAIHNAYPALSARLRELENARARFAEMKTERDLALAELEIVKRERGNRLRLNGEAL